MSAVPEAVHAQTPEVLVAVKTALTAKLILRTLEHAGHRCRLVPLNEALDPAAPLAIVEVPEPHVRPLPHVVGLYDVLPDGDMGDEALGKPLDPDLLIRIVAGRLEANKPARPIAVAPVVEEAPAIDARAIEDLRRLGGEEFVREVVGQFFKDAETLVGVLADHVESHEVHGFQEDAHALRSCAANIGATAVYQLCLAWRKTTEAQLAGEGRAFIARLRHEVDRVLAASRSIAGEPT